MDANNRGKIVKFDRLGSDCGSDGFYSNDTSTLSDDQSRCSVDGASCSDIVLRDSDIDGASCSEYDSPPADFDRDMLMDMIRGAGFDSRHEYDTDGPQGEDRAGDGRVAIGGSEFVLEFEYYTGGNGSHDKDKLIVIEVLYCTIH